MGKRIGIIIGIIFIFIMLLSVAIDGTFMSREYNLVWDDSYINSLETEVEKISALAITASSNHNTQPWKIDIVSNKEVHLYADLDKNLETIDESKNLLLISQGAFLKNFENQAKYRGYDTSINVVNLELEDDKPLAIITLDGFSTSEYIDVISTSTTEVDESGQVNFEVETAAVFDKYPNISYEIVDESNHIDVLKNLLLISKEAELNASDEGVLEDLKETFQFIEKQKNRSQYGFTYEAGNNIFSPLLRSLGYLFLSDDKSFIDLNYNIYEERVSQEEKYILVTVDDVNTINLVETGMLYQELLGELNGYLIRPATHLFETFDEMKPYYDVLNDNFEEENEIILIIGVSTTSETGLSTSIRHDLEDILINVDEE